METASVLNGEALSTTDVRVPGVHPVVAAIRNFIAEVVVGQDVVVERVVIALFTGGHLLLQGVPGLAKTLLVSALAKAVNLQFGRVQFTIDLLPADIIGSEILDQPAARSTSTAARSSPICCWPTRSTGPRPRCNRPCWRPCRSGGSPSAATRCRLPAPFLTIATQNPVEQAGTFELPEAQLDRFMLCHRLHYPDRQQELAIINQSLGLGLAEHDGGAVPADRLRPDPRRAGGRRGRARGSDGPGATGLRQPGLHRTLPGAGAADPRKPLRRPGVQPAGGHRPGHRRPCPGVHSRPRPRQSPTTCSPWPKT